MSKFFSIFGTVRTITPLEQVGNYNKRNVILETSPDENGYTDIYPMEAFGDKAVQKAEQLREGQQITLRFTVRGREYQGRDGGIRYFTSLAFAGVDEKAETERAQRSGARTAQRPAPAPAPASAEEDEDLPF